MLLMLRGAGGALFQFKFDCAAASWTWSRRPLCGRSGACCDWRGVQSTASMLKGMGGTWGRIFSESCFDHDRGVKPHNTGCSATDGGLRACHAWVKTGFLLGKRLLRLRLKLS